MAEDIDVCHPWMNVSLDAMSMCVDQLKDKFWSRIEEYYNNIVIVPSNHTQGSLVHHWGTIQEHGNRWSESVDQVNLAPPVGCRPPSTVVSFKSYTSITTTKRVVIGASVCSIATSF
jgi:hypothetical protein